MTAILLSFLRKQESICLRFTFFQNYFINNRIRLSEAAYLPVSGDSVYGHADDMN
jgi:hypothetical protein